MASRLSNLIPLLLIPLVLTVLTAVQATVLNNYNAQLEPNPATQLSPTARLIKGEEPSPAAKSVLRQNPTLENFDQVVLSLTSSDSSTDELLSERLEASPEQNDVHFRLDDADTTFSPLATSDGDLQLEEEEEEEESQSVQAQAIPPRADGAGSVSTSNTTRGSQGVVFQVGASDKPSQANSSTQVNEMEVPALSNEPSPQSALQSNEDFVTLSVNDVEQDEPQASPALAEESQASIFGALPSLMFDASESDIVFASPMPTDEAPLSVDTESGATSRVELALSVTSSTVTSVSEPFDKECRSYFASATNTDGSDWKAVFISAAKQVEERETKRVQWGVQYQGTLPSEELSDTVQGLQDDIARGGLEKRLRAVVAGGEDVTVQLSDPIKVNVEERAAADVQGVGAVSSGVSSENAATGASAEELSSGSNNSSPTRSRNLGVILGTCLGLLAVVVLSVAVFVFARRRSPSPRHTIDGEEEAPPTLTSIQSLSTDTTASRFHTGAPVNPRGVTVLRNQSRLMDWRMNDAAAAGRTYGTPMAHRLPETQE